MSAKGGGSWGSTKHMGMLGGELSGWLFRLPFQHSEACHARPALRALPLEVRVLHRLDFGPFVFGLYHLASPSVVGWRMLEAIAIRVEAFASRNKAKEKDRRSFDV